MLLEEFFNTGCNTLILKKVQANILEELLQIASIKKQTILHMKAPILSFWGKVGVAPP